MSAAEWLRSVARRETDDDLAPEAAAALGVLAEQAPSLVVACRRMLAHHRAHGPLWWLCARVLAAPDPAAAATEAAALLDADPTAARLAAALPLLDAAECVAVVGWSRSVDLALAERFDVDAVAVRIGPSTASRLRRRTTERAVGLVDPHELGRRAVARTLVPIAAAGAGAVIVPTGTGAVLAAAPDAPAWGVAGVGVVLPARLFAAVRSAAGVDDPTAAEPPGEVLGVEVLAAIATPRGVVAPDDALARPDCPVPPELLRALEA